uniref:Uncharacterized protein n=1 Tax=Brassica oleracea TaxID=3712 RepID=A0A3P6D4F3_BRAOL|nr:unnamed protein product [Brassica oleracea]
MFLLAISLPHFHGLERCVCNNGCGWYQHGWRSSRDRNGVQNYLRCCTSLGHH